MLEPLLSLLLLLSGALLITWRLRRRSERRTHARRVARAEWGETEAERLLTRRGYTILDRQVSERWPVRVDGDEHLVTIRADLLVERRGRIFVAEVKTGGRAPDPLYTATRRQLLEYSLAFEADGLLLVDMERGAIVTIEFPGAWA